MRTVTRSQYTATRYACVSDGGSCLSPQGRVRWVASADSATPRCWVLPVNLHVLGPGTAHAVHRAAGARPIKLPAPGPAYPSWRGAWPESAALKADRKRAGRKRWYMVHTAWGGPAAATSLLPIRVWQETEHGRVRWQWCGVCMALRRGDCAAGIVLWNAPPASPAGKPERGPLAGNA
jgi:hypothetical protein